MANRRSIQFFYTPHNRSTLLDCEFTVAASDAAGFGITGLNEGGRIADVYMHTSTTPATGSPNPNPGLIVVDLQDNYNSFLAELSSISSTVSGSAIAFHAASGGAVTAGEVVIISALGTTATAAQWVAAGLPAKTTPAVGVAFIATAALAAGINADATVKLIEPSGIDHIELVGTVANSNGAGGARLILACYVNSVLTAPADGSVISLMFYCNDSAQGV